MKKNVLLILAAVILILTSALPSQAAGTGGGGGSHHGGGGGYHHGHGGVSFSGGIWVGPGWWGGWGYPYYPYYYPYYPYYYPYYYSEPPVVIERQTPVYVQPNQKQEESDYWYFCTKPQGYYPYVKKCPGGWLKVVPSAPADIDYGDAESPQREHPSKKVSPSNSNEKRY